MITTRNLNPTNTLSYETFGNILSINNASERLKW